MILTIFFLICSVLSFLYAILVWSVHSGTSFFLVWVAAAGVFLILAMANKFHLWKKVKKPVKVIIITLFSLGMLFMIVTQCMIFSCFGSKGDPGLDYLIVLGSQVKESGPSAVTVWRLKAAIEYLENNPDTKVIVSGGQGPNEPAPEAVIMKQYLIENGISEDRILTEERSKNTAENISFSAQLIDIGNDSVGIVTNNFHVFRGVALAKHYGYANVCGIAGGSSLRFLPNNLLRESCGLAKDFLVGNISFFGGKGKAAAVSDNSSAKTTAPVNSHPSGFYEEPFDLVLEAEGNGRIFYTLDGSIPDKEDMVYTGPIRITDISSEDNQLSARTDIMAPTMWGGAFAPSSPVDKATVIRYAEEDANGELGEVNTSTYFVGYQDKDDYYSNVKVISLVTDPDNLFDDEKGIYVTGKKYDEWKDGSEYDPALDQWLVPANYLERGKEWERPVYMEVFQDGVSVSCANAGMRIHGGSSRAAEQKSFNIYMRSEYGYSKYNGDLFSGNNISEYDGSVIDEYDTFVLRDCGNDHKFSRIRDKLIQGLVRERSFATQAMEPCIVFIDGEFWGHYEITERLSDDYIESHFGVDESNVILIKNGELEDGEEGDEEEFSELSKWVRETDFTDPANYEELESRVDLREFAEYMSVQFYIYNYDLSDQNLAVWKARTPDPDNTYADGKWRFILFDTEYSSGIYGQAIYSGNSFKDLEKKECLPRYLFYGAMENEDFRDLFTEAYNDITENDFGNERVDSEITKLDAEYHEMVLDTYDRFWQFWPGGMNRENNLSDQIDDLRDFFEKRKYYSDEDLKELLERY